MLLLSDIVPEKDRENKINEYIEYLDRTRRTNHLTRFDLHKHELSHLTAVYYGITEKEYEELGKEFEKDQTSIPFERE